jgi:chromosome segregation ATPase
MSEKYFNAYIDTAIGTIHEYLAVNLQLKAQSKVISDLIAMKDSEIERLSFIANDVTSKNDELNTKNDELNNLKSQYHNLQGEIERLSFIANDVTSKNDELNTKNDELNNLKSQYHNLQGEIESLRNKASQIDTFTNQIKTMKESLLEKERIIEELSKRDDVKSDKETINNHVKKSVTNKKTRTEVDDDF